MKHIYSLLFILLNTAVFAHYLQPAGYYDEADGKTGYELKTALKTIITNGHTDQGYDNLYTLYESSDTDNYFENDQTVLDMYSEKPSSTDNYEFTHHNDKCGTYSIEGDCYNREHLIPQSVFNSNAPMKSDGHFVVPSDGYVNNKRNNYPFGIVNNPTWTSTNGSKLGDNSTTGYSNTVFEPIDEFKGDIARMLFYFATRYEDQVASWSHDMLNGTSDQVYADWFLDILLQWNQNDPVSTRETDRNEAVYNYQGNRNPFIDHPEWVNEIWSNNTNANPTATSIIAIQDFDGTTPEWTYTPNPDAYNQSGDVWDIVSNIGSINNAQNGSNFWGMQDLENSNGGVSGGDESILHFDNIDVTGYSNVVLSFYYYTDGFDSSDNFKYEVFFDNVSQGVQELDKDTDAWTNVTINVPSGTSQVKLDIKVIQNGGSDYAGLDNVRLEGTAANDPVITNIQHTPNPVTPSDAVNVSADITSAAGIYEVELHWGTTSGNMTNTIQMSNTSGDTYTTDTAIPAQTDGTTIYYEVYAVDNNADDNTSAEQSYLVSNPPNIIISEIAGKGYNADYNDEYIELTNLGSSDVNLNGWQLLYYEGSNLEKTITFGNNDIIAGNDAFVIAVRTSHSADINADYTPSSSFSINNDCHVILKDLDGNIFDEAGSSSDKFNDAYNYEFTDCTGDNKPVANWDNLGTANGTPGTVHCQTPEPEISVKGNNTEITDGDTTPDTADDTDFGNIEVNGASLSHTFTITNTGSADLTINSISSSNSSEFAVSGTTSGTITAGNSIDFTVTFDPSATGTRTATISIDNNDSDENPYDFAVQGTGTNGATSDIIANANFNYTSNIEYVNYQDASITNTQDGNIGVFKFDIRDGGANGDSDNLGTELTDITFSVGSAHVGYIRTAALFDGNGQLANNPNIDTVNGTISFSGLSGADYTAPDDGTKSLTLRVSFTTNVIDNEQLQFTITSAAANSNGSVFAASDAGGAQSSTTNDRNRIEVVATALTFGQQPSNTETNTAMTPPVTVKGIDVNNNLDKDFTDNISLSSSGTMTGDPLTEAASGGVATFNNIAHTTPGTGLILTASHTGFTSITSNPFDVTEIVYENGDYRTTGTGNWLNNESSPEIWERYDGSNWNASNSPSYNTSNAIFIRNGHTINTGGSFGNNVKINIMNGGTLKINHPSTAASTKIYEGGSLKIYKNYQNNGDFEVMDGGTLLIQYEFNNPFTSIWKGTENFHPNSNIIFKDYDCADDNLIEDNNSITPQSYNGYTAVFGNVILDFNDKLENSDDWEMINKNVTLNLAHGNLIFRTNDNNNAKISISKSGTVSSGIGGNLIVESTYESNNNIDLKTNSGTIDFTVLGNVEINSATFRVYSGSNDATSTLNIENDLSIADNASLNFNFTVASNPAAIINLKGDLTVASNGLLQNGNSSHQAVFNFTGSGNGTSPETTQTINIASTSDYENRYIDFNINAGAYVQIINQDFELGKDAKLTVKDGGIFDFGFDGNTALKVTKSGSQTGTGFDLDAGGYLKITSPNGIMSDSSAGNVQVVASNTSFSPLATFHYIGKADQITGDAIGSSSNGRAVIVELADNNLTLSPSQSFGITNATHANINSGNGGILDIRKGQFIETANEYVTGSTGGLKMENGTLYKIVHNSADNTDVIPRMQGLNNAYDLTGGTIELAGDDSQILRGGRDYRNLTFSNAGTKTISSAVPNINGELTIENAAILDVENKTMGGTNTNLNMYNTAQYRTAGTGTKPDAEGDYLLDTNTKIIFTNNESSAEVVRLGQGTPIEYANIDIEGTNVSNSSLTTGIRLEGTFTVKDGATFKLNNTTGFNGGTDTAIDNTNNPTITLETGSTVEYTGTQQTITDYSTGYQNLTVSGTDTKTLGANVITVNENLNVTASTLSVEDGKSISITGNVSNDGSIIIENTGSLVQTTSGTSIGGNGTFQLNKTSLPLNHYYDYVYWSSPIQAGNLTMGDIRPDAWRYYKFDPTIVANGGLYPGWVQLNANDVATAGAGYAVSAPSNHPANTSLSASFIKEHDPFNNGTISVNIYKRGGTNGYGDNNLLGNPYPSAIDFYEFATDNDNKNNIEGSYALWTNCAGLANGHHQEDGYTVYTAGNSSSAQGTATQACSSTTGYSYKAGRYIATGQGFMINGTTDNSSVKFKNSHRVTGNNGNFVNRPTANDRDVVWIDITDADGKFNQIAVGFYDGATDDYDRLFDAKDPNSGSGFNLSSLLDGEKLAIQGLKRTNDINRAVPLAIENDIARNINFHINHFTGFDNIDIYLKDNYLNTTYDLKAGDYLTSVDNGYFDDRFEIIFTQVLNIDDQNIDPNAVLLIQNEGVFNLQATGNHLITGVRVFDVTGKLLYENDSLEQAQLNVNLSYISTGNLLLFHIQLDNKSSLVKKAIKK